MIASLRRILSSRMGDRLFVVILWSLLAALSLYIYLPEIRSMALVDADDWLRLAQVRDLLAGQSWYDLTQYRVDPLHGGSKVHWSRFIDGQIAGLITLLAPLLGPVEAERWVVALYPPLLFLPCLWVLRHILILLSDDRAFVAIGLLMAATGVSFLHFFAPLRIDHHGWQLLLSMIMLLLALGEPSVRRGLIAALVISVHVEISLEGLPYLLIFGGLFAYDWLRDPASAPRLRGFALGLVLFPPLWIMALRGADAVAGVSCDAFSRPFVLGAAVTGALVAGLMTRAGMASSLFRRLTGLIVAGAGGALAFAVSGPACLAGPFAELSPLARDIWYFGITEGRPLWERPLHVIYALAIPSALGLAMLMWAAARMRRTRQAADWHRLLIAATGSVILSVVMLRATAVAHAYIIPGFAMLAVVILHWARGLPSAAARVPATVSVLLAFPISVFVMASSLPAPEDPGRRFATNGSCLSDLAIDRLSRLPPTSFFMTLDKAPELLARTSHRVLATGHHRNHRQIHTIIAAYLAPPDQAESMVRRSGASHILVCRDLIDIQHLGRLAPAGLAARLTADDPPAWLRFEPGLSDGGTRVYRIVPPPVRPMPDVTASVSSAIPSKVEAMK